MASPSTLDVAPTEPDTPLLAMHIPCWTETAKNGGETYQSLQSHAWIPASVQLAPELAGREVAIAHDNALSLRGGVAPPVPRAGTIVLALTAHCDDMPNEPVTVCAGCVAHASKMVLGKRHQNPVLTAADKAMLAQPLNLALVKTTVVGTDGKVAVKVRFNCNYGAFKQRHDNHGADHHCGGIRLTLTVKDGLGLRLDACADARIRSASKVANKSTPSVVTLAMSDSVSASPRKRASVDTSPARKRKPPPQSDKKQRPRKKARKADAPAPAHPSTTVLDLVRDFPVDGLAGFFDSEPVKFAISLQGPSLDWSPATLGKTPADSPLGLVYQAYANKARDVPMDAAPLEAQLKQRVPAVLQGQDAVDAARTVHAYILVLLTRFRVAAAQAASVQHELTELFHALVRANRCHAERHHLASILPGLHAVPAQDTINALLATPWTAEAGYFIVLLRAFFPSLQPGQVWTDSMEQGAMPDHDVIGHYVTNLWPDAARSPVIHGAFEVLQYGTVSMVSLKAALCTVFSDPAATLPLDHFHALYLCALVLATLGATADARLVLAALYRIPATPWHATLMQALEIRTMALTVRLAPLPSERDMTLALRSVNVEEEADPMDLV